MYRIGLLWESNQITVAEEHLATAIVGRVMAALYPRFAQFNVTRGKIIVSAGPNEFHEIGARMVADFLEMAGWDVTYLGANTPAAEILDIIKRQQPFMVALSVATVFNLDNAHQVIKLIKEEQETKKIKVLVGGLAFRGIPELWSEIGADGYAADADSAIPLANEWWANKSGNHD
jgi:methanogenic corrinoid protein MtbC1